MSSELTENWFCNYAASVCLDPFPFCLLCSLTRGGRVNVLSNAHTSPHNRPLPPGAGDPPFEVSCPAPPVSPVRLPPVDADAFWFNGKSAFNFKQTQQCSSTKRTNRLYEDAQRRTLRWQNRMWDPPVKVGVGSAMVQARKEGKRKVRAAKKAKKLQPHQPRQKGINTFDFYRCMPLDRRKERKTIRIENSRGKKQYEQADMSRFERRASTQQEYKVDKTRAAKKVAPQPESLYKQIEEKTVAALTGHRHDDTWQDAAERNAQRQAKSDTFRMKLLKKQKSSAKAGHTRHLTPKIGEEKALKSHSYSPDVLAKLISLAKWMDSMKMRPGDLLNDRGLNFSFDSRSGGDLHGQTNDDIQYKGDESFDARELVGLWKRVGDPIDEQG